VLEQLRLLTNLETDQRKLLQIALFAQPELKTILEAHNMRQLAQRITARFHLSPLNQHETGAYIRHRLHIAGCSHPIFNARTVRQIYKASHGIPRLINQLCNRAMLGIYAQDKTTASSEHIRQAIAEVTGKTALTRRMPWLLGSAGTLLLIVALWLTPASLNPWHTPARAPATVGVQQQATVKTVIAEPTEIKPVADRNSPWGDIDIKSSEAAALQTLASLWNPTIIFDHPQDACTGIQPYHYRCLQGNGDIDLLRALNRPAVIPLRSGSDSVFFTITSLTADIATLRLGMQQWDVPLAELARYWSGDFTLFWQPPQGYITPAGDSDLHMSNIKALIRLNHDIGPRLGPDTKEQG